jgi:hypothetical protein
MVGIKSLDRVTREAELEILLQTTEKKWAMDQAFLKEWTDVPL